MQSIYKVVNNQVTINLPPGFAESEVEVILKHSLSKKTFLRNIEKEIDIGVQSPDSTRSHIEIFDNLREKYEIQ